MYKVRCTMFNALFSVIYFIQITFYYIFVSYKSYIPNKSYESFESFKSYESYEYYETYKPLRSDHTNKFYGIIICNENIRKISKIISIEICNFIT